MPIQDEPMNKPTDSHQQAIKDAFIRCISAGSTLARDEQLLVIERGDPKIAAEVRALLGVADAGSPIEQIFGFVTDPQLVQTDASGPANYDSKNPSTVMESRPGTVIGHYKLLEQIGEGGMGAVFMAQQTEPIKRKVALKLIKPGMDTGQVVARFEAERQALALMDHSNIARVLDAGTTEQGRPYFVMELVRGIPITEYCISKKLSTEARLKLFIDVCHGAQHAHQKGIIHRDLKPNNVLVTLHDGKPVVKIIDFGIAKAVSQDLTERTLFTNFAQLIGTPLYMSPEQAELSGLDIDTRSDVYSLGVLLYELLTGTTPFDRDTLKKVGIEEIRRMIRETDPLKPSQRISTLKAQADSTQSSNPTRDLKRSQLELQGELDWIVMKSLEKERERRYESASAFAADVQRYLNDDPVLACPPSTAYLFRKYNRRHKTKLATGVVMATILVMGMVISMWQAVRATRAQSRADSNAAKAFQQEQNAQNESEKAKAAAIAERGAREAETRERQRSEANVEQAKDRLYYADMRLGTVDWESGNSARLQEKLMGHVPQSGEKDRRGWDWYYLLGLCNQSEKILRDSSGQVASVAWSHNGKYLASTSLDGDVDVYDRNTWKRVGAMNFGAPCRGVCWSADDRYLSWGRAGNGVFVLDVGTENSKSIELKGTRGSVWATAWSPDGEQIASSGMEEKIRIWDWKTQVCTRELNGLNGFSWQLDWNSQGRWLAASVCAGPENKLVWDLNSRDDEMVGPSIPDPTTVRWSPDGRQLAIGTSSGKCLVYKTNTWELTSEWQAHRGRVLSLDWRDDAMQLASAGEDRLIYLWNPATADKILALRGSLKQVNSISWDSSGDFLASGDAMTRIWSLKRPTDTREFNEPDFEAKDFAWSGDATTIIGLGADKVVTWGVLDGKLLSQIPIPPGENKRLNPDGSRFVMTVEADQQKSMNLFDAKSGNLLRSIIPETEVVNRLLDSFHFAFSPDGSSLAISERKLLDSLNIIIANLSGDRNLVQFISGIKLPSGIAWSPDGKLIAGFGLGDINHENAKYGYVHVFDVAKQSRIMLARQGPAVCKSLAWSPDGNQLVCGDGDGVAAIWDISNQRKTASANLHSSPINFLAWTPDGKRIASASLDNTICVWEPVSGEELIRLSLPTLGGAKIKWFPDGRQLAALTVDGIIHEWDALGYDFCKTDEFAFLNVHGQLNNAVQLWEKGSKDEAKTLAEKSLQHDILKSQRLPTWVTTDWIGIVANNDDDSLLDFTSERLTDEPRLHFSLIRKRLRENRRDEAMAMIRSSLEKTNNSYVTYAGAGMLLYQNGFYDEAFSILREGTRYDAKDSGTLNNLARYLATCPEERLRDYDQSLKYARMAFELAPSTDYAPRTLGVALFRKGEWDEAIEHLKIASETSSGSANYVWYFLAMCSWRLDEKEKAREWYDKAVKWTDSQPENSELIGFRAEATKLLGIVPKSDSGESDTPK